MVADNMMLIGQTSPFPLLRDVFSYITPLGGGMSMWRHDYITYMA